MTGVGIWLWSCRPPSPSVTTKLPGRWTSKMAEGEKRSCFRRWKHKRKAVVEMDKRFFGVEMDKRFFGPRWS